MKTKINTARFFSMKYRTLDGRIQKYICRSGVTVWETMSGDLEMVKGIGYPVNKKTHIRLYCANRKGYRTFIKSRIIEVKQSNHIQTTI